MNQLIFSLMFVLLAGSHFAQVKADGNRDNDSDDVRRIPRVGIKIPQERERQLRQQHESSAEANSYVVDRQK